MPELILRSGKRAGRRIALPAGDVVLGRDEGCRIRLTSSDISRRHCVLRISGDQIVIADLGSRNGTFVNDAPVTKPTSMRPGDLLRVGPFLFQIPGSAGAALADDDIGGWLTEEGTIAGGPPPGVKNDTTSMPELEGDTDSTGEMWIGPPDEQEASLPPARSEQKDPIVVQAGQIIRDYWNTKKGRR